MPQDLSSVQGKIIGRSVPLFRKSLLMPRLITSDWSAEAAQKADTINVRLPIPGATGDVTPGPVPPAGNDKTPRTVPLVLNKWKYGKYAMTDKEAGEIEARPNYLPPALEGELNSLSEQINADIFATYKDVYSMVGTAGTTPFGSDITHATGARKLLNKLSIPTSNRRCVVDPDAEEKLLLRSEFRDASQSADPNPILEGVIGRKLGFDWAMDQQVPTHTSTPLTAGACTVNGAQAANVGSTDGGRTGTLSIAKATNAAPLVAGDVIEFTVGGVVQQHTVVTGVTLAVGNTSVTVAPALRVATAGGETVTLRATHVVNLCLLYTSDAADDLREV
jgi:hypothetical protein